MAVRLAIDASELIEYAKKLGVVKTHTTPIITTGLNEIGDGLITVLANNLAKQTGLDLEEIRGVMNIKRASRTSMSYEISINPTLIEGDVTQLEGSRASGDFGKRQPGALVIVVTRKDELVCMDCEELEAAGPMPVETAMAHVPKHPNCRCVIMPYVPKGRRLPVTMTTMSGTDPLRRAGAAVDLDITIRQLAQDLMKKSANKIRIELS